MHSNDYILKSADSLDHSRQITFVFIYYILRQLSIAFVFTCKHSVLDLHQCVAAAHLDAQVNHKEHGDIHYDALDQQRKLIVFVEP